MRRAAGVLLSAALTGASVPAVAQPAAPCSGDPRECGKREFEAGIETFQRGRFAEAAERFRAALGYKDHPTIEFNLALAEVELGRFVAAVDHFTRVIGSPEAPPETVVRARTERAAAEGKIATVALDGAPAGARLEVDGRSYDDHEARVDPGEHHVRVLSGDRASIDRRLMLGPGERVRLAVSREREILAPGAPPPPVAAPSTPPERAERSGLSPAWVWVGAGVTVVLGGLTTWSALDTRRDFADFEDDLAAGRLTQDEADRRIDDGMARELRTNVLIGATAIAGATTAAVALFGVSWGGSSTNVGLSPRGVVLGTRF